MEGGGVEEGLELFLLLFLKMSACCQPAKSVTVEKGGSQRGFDSEQDGVLSRLGWELGVGRDIFSGQRETKNISEEAGMLVDLVAGRNKWASLSGASLFQ